MKETGRVRVLGNGISERQYRPQEEGGDMLRPLEKGAEFEFTHVRLAAEPDTSLYIGPTHFENGLQARLHHTVSIIQEDSPLTVPDYSVRSTYETTIGTTPEGALTVEFGKPEPALEVTYLGHPHRDDVKRLMTGQSPDANEEFFSDTEKKGKLLFSSPPVPALTSGMNNDYPEYGPGNTETSNAGVVLLGAYVSEPRKKIDKERRLINVFAGVESEADGIIRVKSHDRIIGIYPDNKIQQASRVIDELAAVSVFSQTFGEPQYEALRGDFPLAFINYTSHDLSIRADRGNPGGWYGEFKRYYDMDWEEIRNNLPQEEIAEETRRLASVLHVQYETAPPPPPPKLRRGRGTRRPYRSY